MGMNEILADIIKEGEVLQKVLDDKHKPHGPLSSQLEKLRKNKLVERRSVKLMDGNGRFRPHWIYFPTERALKLYGKEVVK